MNPIRMDIKRWKWVGLDAIKMLEQLCSSGLDEKIRLKTLTFKWSMYYVSTLYLVVKLFIITSTQMHNAAYIAVSVFGGKEYIFCPGIWKAQQRNKGSELTALSSEN